MKTEEIRKKISWQMPFRDGDCFGATKPDVYGDDYYHVVTGNRHIAITTSKPEGAEMKQRLLYLDNRPVNPNKYPVRHKKILGVIKTLFFQDKWYTPKPIRIKFAEDDELDIKHDEQVKEEILA